MATPDLPAPPPDLVTASRRHLADQYARGVDQLFLELEKRPMEDASAVRALLAESALGLLRAAYALDRCAQWRGKTVTGEQKDQLQRHREEYAKAAANYRDMAMRYRQIGGHLH